MRDGWREVAVEDVARVVGGGTPRSSVPEFWGGDIQWLTPKDLSDRPSRYTSEGSRTITEAGLKGSGAKVLPPGAVLLTSRAPVGYVSVASAPISTNQGFKSLILQEDQLPEFWYYLLLHSTEYLRANSGGSTFQELSGGALKKLRFTIPPIKAQRRIVDLIGAVDDVIAASETSKAAATRILDGSRRIVSTAATRALGELAIMRSGPSWKAADEKKEPAEGYEPVLGITNTPPGLRLDLGDKRFVASLPASVQRLDDASLVMIRTNGNRSRIGNIYRATKDVEGFAVSAFQIALRPHRQQDAAFLYWYLGSSGVQAAISENASGSTGLGNIAIGWLKKLAVPVLSSEEMARYVGKCEAAAAVVQATDDELTELRRLRSNLLSALLSGEHEIPSSYDAMLRTTE